MVNDKLKNRFVQIRWILIGVLVLNWTVAAAKIVLGYITRCQSMVADGFHSLADGASNIIGLVGLTISSRPVDKDHPYGHKKYETLFSLGIAALLIFVAVNLAKEGVFRFISPETPHVAVTSFTIMIISMIMNSMIMHFERSEGRRLGSDILVADSMHTRSDILTSFSVIVALVAIKAGYPVVDPIISIIIAIVIGYAAFEIIRNASRILCDTVANIDINKVTSIVMGIKGVKACHKIRTRGRPDDVCIDLHVQVDSSMQVKDAHDICYAIEDTIKKEMNHVTDVLVHIEPKGRPRE